MKSSSYSEHRYRCCRHSELASDISSCQNLLRSLYLTFPLKPVSVLETRPLSVLVLWKYSFLRTNLNHCSSSLTDRLSDLHPIQAIVWSSEPFVDIWQGLGRWDQPIARRMGEVLLNWFPLLCKAVTSLTYEYIEAEQFVRLHGGRKCRSKCITRGRQLLWDEDTGVPKHGAVITYV
jgi:hypothetical protein